MPLKGPQNTLEGPISVISGSLFWLPFSGNQGSPWLVLSYHVFVYLHISTVAQRLSRSNMSTLPSQQPCARGGAHRPLGLLLWKCFRIIAQRRI